MSRWMSRRDGWRLHGPQLNYRNPAFGNSIPERR
jgi:hypothetical protein